MNKKFDILHTESETDKIFLKILSVEDDCAEALIHQILKIGCCMSREKMLKILQAVHSND